MVQAYSSKGGRREKIDDRFGRVCYLYGISAGADTETSDGKRPDLLGHNLHCRPDGQVQADCAEACRCDGKEPGTLEYEYAVGDDQKTVDVFERYTNSHAAVVHVTENFGPNFSKDFLAVAKPGRFVVYGVPTDELKKTLADFKPVYMTPFDGFTK